MIQQKTILFKLSEGELWHSLKTHSKTLAQHYLKTNKALKIINWSNNYSELTAKEINKHFIGECKIKIICIDPQIPISEIIHWINYFDIKEAHLILHCYGDFIRQMPPLKKALATNKATIHATTYFPSLRVCRAFNTIFNSRSGIIKQPINYKNHPHGKYNLPFPVLQNKGRKIGYIGRIEQTKNIIEAIKLLEKAYYFDQGELFIAGQIDNHHYHYSQKHSHNNYLLNLTSYIKKLTPRVSSKIHFVGHLEQAELSSFIKKMDLMFNLSTFYGECFGVSVRQVIDLNQPIILSNWGGFSDVQKSKKVKFVDIDPSKKGHLKINATQFETALAGLLNLKLKRISNNKNKKINLTFSQQTFKLKKINLLSETEWNHFMAGVSR